jgi:hypothetical protein
MKSVNKFMKKIEGQSLHKGFKIIVQKMMEQEYEINLLKEEIIKLNKENNPPKTIKKFI